MKKLLLLLLLLTSNIISAQDEFVRNFTKLSTSDSQQLNTKSYFRFNIEVDNEIYHTLKVENYEIMTLKQVSNTVNGKTKNNESYTMIEVYEINSGKYHLLQLFDTGEVRLILEDNNSLTFKN